MTYQVKESIVKSVLMPLCCSFLWVCVFLVTLGSPMTQAADRVDKWRRYVVVLPNRSHSGNPFEIEVDATFTHPATGTTLTLPGYYAGNDTWKVAFMPTLTGEWTYKTDSPDADLDGVSGSVISVASGHPGMLKADVTHAKKWRYTDGPYVVPIGLQFSVFLESASIGEITQIADFLKNEVKGHLFNFRLTNLAFSGNWKHHKFNLSLWDRLDERMEILTERGLGISLMLYTDDHGKPKWKEKSSTERLLIRYTVARLAAYPVVWFNTGIDIKEFRSGRWVNWYGKQIRSLDPYGHPVSSRYGGGSGNLVMSAQNFDSRGASTAIIQELINFFKSSKLPVSIDDNWGEQFSRGNFSPSDIRRAFWKCVMAGGIASHIRDNKKSDFPGANDPDAWFHVHNVASKLEAEKWLRLINPFVQTKLRDTFGSMVPTSSLVSNGYSLADPSRTKILYFLMGKNDQFDSGNGKAITVKLSSLSGIYTATWFDPRTGRETILGTLTGGSNHVLSPPSSDDWVLLLSDSRIAAPKNLRVNQ